MFGCIVSHRGLLLLSDALALVVEELDLDVGVGGASQVHLLQLARLQNRHCIVSCRILASRSIGVHFCVC